MKILIDARLLVRGRSSGIEEYTRFLVEHLLKLDSANRYDLFYNGFRKAPFPENWLKHANVSLIDWWIPNKFLDFAMKFLAIPDIEQISDADIVFSPHFNLLCNRRKKKRVITFHDLSFVHYPEFYPPRKRLWHWQQNYKREAHNADKIVAVSDFTRYDLIETLGIEPQKIETVYSGINPYYTRLSPGDEELLLFREKNGLADPFLLFVGVLEPRKNIPVLVKTFNLLKQNRSFAKLKLLIAGERGWLYEEIFGEVRNSPFAKDIRIWGRATEKELRFLYNLASAFVYPSVFEGFGFPPLEAQACGTAVVASNRSSLPEILGNSALLVDPSNIRELKEALSAIVADRNLREKHIKLGKINSSRFDWDVSARHLINIFNSFRKTN